MGDGIDSARHQVGVVAVAVVGKTEQVASGLDSKAQRLFEAVLFCYGTHGEVVGYNDSVESKLVAQHFLDDCGGERGGQVVAQVGVDDVSGHDHVGVAVGYQGAIGFELGLFPSAGNVYQPGVGVSFGTAVAGEVFEAGDDAFFVVCLDVERGVLGYGGGVIGEAASQASDDGA